MKQSTEGKDAMSKLFLEALTLKGNGNFKESKLCECLYVCMSDLNNIGFLLTS